MLDRNPGSGEAGVEVAADGLRAITQIVFHDAARPSRLVLPVVDERGAG